MIDYLFVTTEQLGRKCNCKFQSFKICELGTEVWSGKTGIGDFRVVEGGALRGITIYCCNKIKI